MNPQFPAAPPAIIGAAMMALLAERVGLLRGRDAAGHQGSRQRQRWCRCGAGERQGLVACVGGQSRETWYNSIEDKHAAWEELD